MLHPAFVDGECAHSVWVGRGRPGSRPVRVYPPGRLSRRPALQILPAEIGVHSRLQAVVFALRYGIVEVRRYLRDGRWSGRTFGTGRRGFDKAVVAVVA